jgi:hypothetical protein
VRRPLRIHNVTRGTIVAERCDVAASYLRRMFGLIPRARLDEGEGLLLLRTSAITMMLMRFAIDAIALRGDGTVVACWRRLRPWLPAAWARGAASVLELPVGTIDRSGTQAGDQLRFEEVAQGAAVREVS